jgi:ribosomal protein S19
MSRSLWKSFLFNEYLLKTFLNKKKNKKLQLQTKLTNTIILPLFLNTVWKVYNGKQYVKLKVVKEMIGYRFGDFISTRKKTIHKRK